MSNVAIKSTAYCLGYASELGLHYGTTTSTEREQNENSVFLTELEKTVKDFETVCRYAPNLTYIGALSVEELEKQAKPWIDNLLPKAVRFGKFGEIMPEDEFLALLDMCDVFDLVWLEKNFVSTVRAKFASHPVIREGQLKRLKQGREIVEIQQEVEKHALPLYFNGKVVGCCRPGHETDPNLNAHVLLENLASKAGAVLALLHLIKNSELSPDDIEFVVDCSEEAVGDINQRGGGNMAKAIAEIAGCSNASGFDLRAFCAAPVAALVASGSMVAAGVHKNVAVVSGGSIPKLYMNAREHVRKQVAPMENVTGCFAALLTKDDGNTPVIRLDTVGKHSVAAGASPQAVTTALVWEPLQKAGLKFTDVDKYAPELHDPEITLPAGAGNVPEANFKMIAALAVMKGQYEKIAIPAFVEKHGMLGFAPTQGHIPSGVPYLGHAVEGIKAGKIKRAMIIGKGSLFLGRLTNLADGASFLVEAAKPATTDIARDDVEAVILELLADMAKRLKA